MNCITGAFWKKSISPRFPAHRFSLEFAPLPPSGFPRQERKPQESRKQDTPSLSGPVLRLRSANARLRHIRRWIPAPASRRKKLQREGQTSAQRRRAAATNVLFGLRVVKSRRLMPSSSLPSDCTEHARPRFHLLLEGNPNSERP